MKINLNLRAILEMNETAILQELLKKMQIF